MGSVGGRGRGGQEASSEAVDIVGGGPGVGAERHQGPLTIRQDSGLVSHREALRPFPRGAPVTPGFTRAGRHISRPNSVT